MGGEQRNREKTERWDIQIIISSFPLSLICVQPLILHSDRCREGERLPPLYLNQNRETSFAKIIIDATPYTIDRHSSGYVGDESVAISSGVLEIGRQSSIDRQLLIISWLTTLGRLTFFTSNFRRFVPVDKFLFGKRQVGRTWCGQLMTGF